MVAQQPLQTPQSGCLVLPLPLPLPLDLDGFGLLQQGIELGHRRQGTKARIWARQAGWYVAAVLASSFQDKK